jgi:rhodanese-related sulfurtransferase
MDTGKNRKNDIYALAIGGTLVLLVGAYFIGKSLSGNSTGNTPSVLGGGSGQVKGFLEVSEDAPFIGVDTLSQKIKNGDKIRFVDIRSAEEYQVEHIKDSIQLSPAAFDGFSVDQGETAIIIFSEGDTITFETAKNIFKRKSIPYVFLSGGISAWRLAGFPTVSIGDPRSFLDQSKIIYISPDELKTFLEKDPESVFLIDVQSEEEYQKGHIKGAMNLPLSDLEKKLSQVHVPTARIIVVYGATDVASFQAGVRISDLGIMSVKTLSGNDTLASTSGFPIDHNK